jgi:hypothetical protein
LLALFLGVCLALHCEASTSFYVDPDWTGSKSGTQAHPFAMLNKSAWQRINAALANGDVTIYFSALKADGATQQSQTTYVNVKRTNPGSFRLTLDGYTKYNSNETTPSWLANPDTDITHAYLNGKVFKIIGNGDNALGWSRVDGNDFVTHNGTVFCCIESHVASSDNEPGVGPNWQLYWDQHGTSSTAWNSGTSYKCYAKQNNVTLRGFETTGPGGRCQFGGDNFIWEYNYVHDVTIIGPGMQLSYTSQVDGSGNYQIISRPSTNLTFRYFTNVRTFGEGFYIGSINPDASAAFQALHGNQHSHILIENFLIDHPAANGGQGDGIDCKQGVTHLTIRLGEIRGFGVNGNGINLPMSASNINQYILVERNFIHNATFDNQGAQRAIHAQTGFVLDASLYGFNGVTIRNNIIANCLEGIQFDGAPGQPATYGFIYNNTIYGATEVGLEANVNVSNTEVKNNLVLGGASPQAYIASSGVTSDYNAHDGTWISSNEGSHTLALTSSQAVAAVVNAAVEDFHLSASSVLIGKALTISNFSDDFYQRSRTPGNWNIGAVQVGGDVSAVPCGLHVVP